MRKKKSRPPPKVAYSDEEGGQLPEPNDEITVDVADLFNPFTPAATPSVSGVEDVTPLPCGISGLGSALSSGAMGFVFGGGGQMIRHRGPGRWKAVTTEGFNSTKTFALMGGLYAAVSCYSQRIRQKDDPWNGFASGCVSGLALSWGGTPMAMAQSTLGFGLFSLAFDYMGARKAAVPPAEAAALPSLSSSPCLVSAHTSRRQQQGWPLRCSSCSIVPRQAASANDVQQDQEVPPPLMQMLLQSCSSQPLLTPAAMWLRPLQAAKQHVHNRLSALQNNKAV